MEKFENYKFESTDFELCQNNEKIYDKKLETKPVSFLQDAMKRFVKNKSSVVAGVIIGILLLMSFVVPVLSPYDGAIRPYQTELPGRIFDAGTGFMDGTKKYSNQPYDFKNDKVAGTTFKSNAISNLKLTTLGDNYINNPTLGAYGGTLVVLNEKDSTIYANSKEFTFTQSDNLKLNIKFNDTVDKYGEMAEYAVFVRQLNSEGLFVKNHYVQDFSKSTVDVELDLSSIFATNSIPADSKFIVGFEVNANAAKKCHIPLKEFTFTTTNTDEDFVEFVSLLGMSDANAKLYAAREETEPENTVWNSTGSLLLHEADIVYASFTYDKYEAAFGNIKMTVDHYSMQDYIAKGWCTYDFEVGESSFVKLSEKCPIDKVNKQIEIRYKDKVIYDLESDVTAYKYYGFNSMPKYIFGTDKNGRDLFTNVFTGLKTSLLLGLVISAICFSVGIVWGSISGYYGGNVDLFMERALELFSGIPSTVLLTLVILNLGNNIVSMGIALVMTGWIGTASGTRTQFYRFKGREYVLASRTLGAKDRRLIFKHILPNAMGTLITSSILMIPGVIGTEASIAYLGLGLENSNTLGVILVDNQAAIHYEPILIIFPALIMSLLMISFNLFGNGLRDAFNTSLKGSE